MAGNFQFEKQQQIPTKYATRSDQQNESYIRSAGATGGGDAPMHQFMRVQEPSVRPMTLAWNSMLRNIGNFELPGQRGYNLAPNPQVLRIYGPPIYARKVFIGGLPHDIDDLQLSRFFSRFGPVIVDWPHKNETQSTNPPRGFAFLLFSNEKSVQYLVDTCQKTNRKLYIHISSRRIHDRMVQVRPWHLTDADYCVIENITLDLHHMIFIGGVPRPVTAYTLATIFEHMYGGVCYAGIDTDPDLKYPKGSGRVAFNNDQSYLNALGRRYVRLQHAEVNKRVEVKPYLLENQMCERCGGENCNGMFATLFCSNVECRMYYCEHCWTIWHATPHTAAHKPIIRNASERLRYSAFRWF